MPDPIAATPQRIGEIRQALDHYRRFCDMVVKERQSSEPPIHPTDDWYAEVSDALGEALALLDAQATRIGELEEALKVIHTAARDDEQSECWTIRKWLDERDVFNNDIQGSERLIELACNEALRPTPPGGVTP